jgi:hypothetical protein
MVTLAEASVLMDKAMETPRRGRGRLEIFAASPAFT